jgi:hypothetical protein
MLDPEATVGSNAQKDTEPQHPLPQLFWILIEDPVKVDDKDDLDHGDGAASDEHHIARGPDEKGDELGEVARHRSKSDREEHGPADEAACSMGRFDVVGKEEEDNIGGLTLNTVPTTIYYSKYPHTVLKKNLRIYSKKSFIL